METNKEIGLEILNQLGGYNRLNIILGLKDCLVIENGISFKIKYKHSVGNYIKIQLNSMDLYDIEIGKVRGTSYKVIKSINDVYNNQLKNIIEDTCKVRLSL